MSNKTTINRHLSIYCYFNVKIGYTIIQAQGCTSSNKSDDQQCSAPPHQQFSVSLLIGFYLSSLRSQQSTFSIFDLHFISKFLNNGYNNVMPRRNVSRHSAKRFRNFRISYPLSDEASLAWLDMTGLLLILEFSFQITSHNIILDTAHQKDKSEVFCYNISICTY